jgi:hypothetical protein
MTNPTLIDYLSDGSRGANVAGRSAAGTHPARALCYESKQTRQDLPLRELLAITMTAPLKSPTLAPAAAAVLLLLAAAGALGYGQGSPMSSAPAHAQQGPTLPPCGPGVTGPEMDWNMTPVERLEWIRQHNCAPGWLRSLPPQQQQAYWQELRQSLGYGAPAPVPETIPEGTAEKRGAPASGRPEPAQTARDTTTAGITGSSSDQHGGAPVQPSESGGNR